VTGRAAAVVKALFEIYLDMPLFASNADSEPDSGAGSVAARARRIADYVAGMTDRYAIAEHERRIGPVRFE
jgi:dGTPase